MAFDLFALSAVRQELEPRLADGRIQKLVFPDELSVAVEVFRPGTGRTSVLLSVHPELGRIQQVPRLPARGTEHDSPFALAARKHLRHARILSLRQPPLERILELKCEQRDEADRQYEIHLIVEAMGRRGNLLLVGADGRIVDALRRTPPSRNPRRPVLPHLPYDPPPPQRRLDPSEATAQALADRAPDGEVPLQRYLLDTIAGLSPLASREIAFRATGSTDAWPATVDWVGVARAVRAFYEPLETGRWQPTVALDEQQVPVDCAPYVPRHLEARGARLQPAATMSAALAEVYERGRPSRLAARDPLIAEKRALARPLARSLEQTRRRIRALEHQLTLGETELVPLREAGQAILAHQWELEPGATALAVDGEAIALDPRLTAVENAQRYFARYRKAREAVERVPQLLEEAQQREQYLAQLAALVDVASSMDAIRALRREVGAAEGTRAEPKGKSTPPTSGPVRRVPLGDGWEALVGGSARGNAVVTFDMARPDDTWFHARGVPGAHVILRSTAGNGTPPAEMVRRAAALAAAHSSARAAGQVDVDFVARRQVRRVPNGPPGLVRYSDATTIRLDPSEAL
ncbi:MAG: NFACT family protein [Chloroflexi bacterium]|nr:NFACT family protein [Chloroflexota bacterium]